MRDMNQVAAVVVTYNRLVLLQECIQALLGQTEPCDILIVDNASTDGTKEYIEELCRDHPSIRYQNTGANIGGAGGFNRGMRWAVEAGYAYVWVMDDDCLPCPDALERLMEAHALLGDRYGWLASQVLWTDGQECRMNRVKVKKGYVGGPAQERLGIRQARQATFVSLFLKARTIKMAGLPIREFFIWGDDIEYTRRIAVRANIPCFLVGRSKVIHAMKDNTGSNIATDAPERLSRYTYAFRNENYLYRQEGWKGVCYYLAKCGWNMVKILIRSKNYRGRRILLIIRSMLAGCAFRPKVEHIL